MRFLLASIAPLRARRELNVSQSLSSVGSVGTLLNDVHTPTEVGCSRMNISNYAVESTAGSQTDHPLRDGRRPKSAYW